MMRKEIRNTNKNYGQSIPDGPTFSGPVHKRSFTDVICCLIFVAAMVGYVILGGAAWLYGNPQYITKEQNSAGAFCGMGPNFDKPNLFYFNILKCALAVNVAASTFKGLQCPTTQVCIKNCPSTFWFLPKTAFSAGAKPSEFFQQEFCDPSLDLAQTTFTVQEILDKGLCPAYYTPSTLVQGKCLPSFDPKDVPLDLNFYKSTFGNDTVKVIMDTSRSLRTGFNLKSRTVRIIEDLAITWYWILVGLVIALVVSLVLLLLMRCCVSLVSILFLPGLLSLGAYGIYQCYQYEKDINSQLKLGDLSFQSKMSDYLQVKEIWLGCIVTVCLLEFILVMLFISYLRKGLTAALALMKECSKAMGVLSSTMAYPLVTFLLVILCMTFFTVTNVNLVTSGLPVYKKLALNTSNANCTAVTGEEKCVPEVSEIKVGQCTLARTFSSYYWSLSNLHNIRRSVVSNALFQMLRYHTGSMAFGAIFVNMFQGIRMFLEFLKDVTRGGQRCCCCCLPLMMLLKCCFCVLDKVLKYFSRNTYIMIATHGDNFFTSAKNAHMLCERNKDRVRMVDRTTDWLLFFGRLLVVGAIGVLAFYFFNADISVSADIFQVELLSFRWLHFTVVIVGTYFIAEGCFSVYSMGVDTFTICVMDDLERNDGTFQRPYMSRSLQQILQLQDDSVL